MSELVSLIGLQKKEIDRLKAENEELKLFLSKEPLALQALQTGYASYKKSSETFYNMVKDYKQAIEKIKEVANRIYGEVITENWQSLLGKQILQICDEVINE